MNEDELVSRASLGDEDAFAALVNRNQNRVYSLALRMAGNPDDAAELCQEAFLKAWKGLPRFQGGCTFSTWLYRLTSNVCIDFLRRERRHREISLTISMDAEKDRQADLPDTQPGPEQHVQRLELRQAITSGLSVLSPEHRQILILREIEGLSYGEISQILSLECGTVKSRIARARMALRKILIAGGNFPTKASSKL